MNKPLTTVSYIETYSIFKDGVECLTTQFGIKATTESRKFKKNYPVAVITLVTKKTRIVQTVKEIRVNKTKKRK